MVVGKNLFTSLPSRRILLNGHPDHPDLQKNRHTKSCPALYKDKNETCLVITKLETLRKTDELSFSTPSHPKRLHLSGCSNRPTGWCMRSGVQAHLYLSKMAEGYLWQVEAIHIFSKQKYAANYVPGNWIPQVSLFSLGFSAMGIGQDPFKSPNESQRKHPKQVFIIPDKLPDCF